jgi:hypothetical protein
VSEQLRELLVELGEADVVAAPLRLGFVEAPFQWPAGRIAGPF